ncbi:hypothetical protein ABEB36_010419 [Hypothenemus hampei]|uniref:Transcription factor cwo n=1 Tax=Hypothenemus hampei TaxID=57062 RepID=A0ABD1EJN5_HYPHA
MLRFQDPMSHRIIEKRRRDRMNNCLADLSRLIPTEYLKKGRGRIEKTEIIEMAIKHMKHLQAQERPNPLEHYRLGYQECISEAMRFMVEVEGHFPREPVCMRLLNHLQKHCEQISKAAPAYPMSPLEPIASFPVQVPSLLRNGVQGITNTKITELSVPKAEPENSNSNDTHPGAFALKTSTCVDLEKESGNNAMSYKYKTDIKLRFSQDLNAHEAPKRRKLDNGRRTSVTIYENQSSNQSSPPSSEPCTRISESETIHRHTPDDLSTIGIQQKNGDLPRHDVVQRLSPNSITVSNTNENNFNVPIFVFHKKGSYYIPLSIDYKTLLPYLQNYNITEATTHVLHPVTINVNFMPNFNDFQKKCNYEFNNNWN